MDSGGGSRGGCVACAMGVAPEGEVGITDVRGGVGERHVIGFKSVMSLVMILLCWFSYVCGCVGRVVSCGALVQCGYTVCHGIGALLVWMGEYGG